MRVLGEQTAVRAMRSGELAKMAGVSRDTLRHYERNGLLPLPQRAANGYRRYPPQALERMRLIRSALAIGFTVEELREIFAARDRGLAPCQQVYSLAVRKREALRAHIDELQALQAALEKAIRDWAKKLKAVEPGKRAGLLEMFVANHPESMRSLSPMMSPGLKKKLEREAKQHETHPGSGSNHRGARNGRSGAATWQRPAR
jgi:MerR family transcriptional regulator, copper efflux regulator